MQTKTLIAGIDIEQYDMENSFKELTALCEANELLVVCEVVQKRLRPDPKHYFGIGKLEEIKTLCKNLEVELCVLDEEVSPSQIKNIQDFLEIEVIDRTMLILEIFKNRATTSEGKLQTELAVLKYRLPRLRSTMSALSRQGGSSGGAMGARRGGGETKLENNRRYIQSRINYISEKLKEVKKRREFLNEARKKNDVPIIALCGYTNVGKSSLLNLLTDSEIFEKDMLFATLDPVARKFVLPSGQTCIIVDTVGFVSRLPHKLIEAFKSTLEQVKYADVIVNVCDIASPDRQEQLKVTNEVLSDLGCDLDDIITVYNKSDKDHEELFCDNEIVTSTKTKKGIDKLILAIDEKLKDRVVNFSICLPYEKTSLVNTIRENGSVKTEEYTQDGIMVTGNIDKKMFHLIKKYQN